MTVYIYDPFTELIMVGYTTEIQKETCVTDLWSVDPQGNKYAKIYSTYIVESNNIWETIEEAFKTVKQRDEALEEKYCNEMQTFEDFVNFALTHVLYGENMEAAAARAFKRRAKGFESQIS